MLVPANGLSTGIARMAEHLWTVLCSKAVFDKDTNNVSLIEIIEELAVSPLPEQEKITLPISLELVMLTMRSEPDQPESVAGQLSLLTPEGNKLPSGRFEIDLSEKLRHRTRMRMSTLPLEGPGLYHFLIEFLDKETDKWSEVYRLPLNIHHTQNEQQASAK